MATLRERFKNAWQAFTGTPPKETIPRNFVQEISIAFGRVIEDSVKRGMAVKQSKSSVEDPIYSVYLENESQNLVALISTAAKNDEDALKRAAKTLQETGNNPDHFTAKTSLSLDIAKGNTSAVVITAPGKIVAVPHKPLPIENYIQSLEYVRDSFCQTPHQKGVVTSIVNQIRKKYNFNNNESAPRDSSGE
jgi:hypothetical protein